MAAVRAAPESERMKLITAARRLRVYVEKMGNTTDADQPYRDVMLVNAYIDGPKPEVAAQPVARRYRYRNDPTKRWRYDELLGREAYPEDFETEYLYAKIHGV